MAAAVADAAMVDVVGVYAAQVSSAWWTDCGVSCVYEQSMLSISVLSWAPVQHQKVCASTGSVPRA